MASDIFPKTLRRWRDWRGPIAFPGRKKPASLIYDVDDIPPMAVQIAAAFQHLFVISVGWIYVILVVSAIGGTSAEAQSLIRMSMIASGIATIVQSKRRIGNGYLCPLTCSLTYLSPVVLAGIAGGYSLMFGMLLTAGTAGNARFARRPSLADVVSPGGYRPHGRYVGAAIGGIGMPAFSRLL